MTHAPFTPEKQADLLKSTKEAAAAFVQDMGHIREISKRPIPDAGEIRRVSGTLRRLLIDNGGGDLRKIAPPRIGKYTLRTLDNSNYYAVGNKHPFTLFISGKLGEPFSYRGITLHRPAISFNVPAVKENIFVDVSLDGFLSNRILCINNNWLTRKDTIKYVANVASGVHSRSYQDKDEKNFLRIRECVTFSIKQNGIPDATIDIDAHMLINPDFIFKQKSIDPIVNELNITCYLLSESPDLIKLESFIRSEMNMSLPNGDDSSIA